MGNSGKNSNSSQFFFTLDSAPQCDGKHVIFGECISGFDVLKKAEKFGTADGDTTAPITITDCGISLHFILLVQDSGTISQIWNVGMEFHQHL